MIGIDDFLKEYKVNLLKYLEFQTYKTQRKKSIREDVKDACVPQSSRVEALTRGIMDLDVGPLGAD